MTPRSLVAFAVTAVFGLTPAAACAALSAPVIHEPFTALPCTGTPGHRTTVALEGCAEHQILKGDTQIDGLNKTIFNALGDTAARKRFVTGHRAWLAYRTAYCRSMGDVFEGGTESAVVAAQCEVAVNATHVRELKMFRADLVDE